MSHHILLLGKCGNKWFPCILFNSLSCSHRFLMPSLQPYGGRGWTLSCLLPPSCISLYANVLLKLESAQRGISRETLHLSVNSQLSFSAATVFQMLLLDIVLYAVLTWYLDQVCPHLLLTISSAHTISLHSPSQLHASSHLHLPCHLHSLSHLHSESAYAAFETCNWFCDMFSLRSSCA